MVYLWFSGEEGLELPSRRNDESAIEELTQVLNDYFGRLIDLITAHGGDVAKFAGDALLAFWRAAGPEGLATAAMLEHNEADDAQPGFGGGADGFKLVGMVLSFAIKSQSFPMAMGAYGAGRSVYVNFIARGQDVVFPRNTLMEIGIGSRRKTALKP